MEMEELVEWMAGGGWTGEYRKDILWHKCENFQSD